MASFSSIGIGLGGNVDVNGLIKASVDAVRFPISKTNGLSQQAALTNAKVSTFGQMKSLVSALSDAASKLGSVTSWNGVSASSSKSDTVSVSATGGSAATSFNVQVQSLASAQSSMSPPLQPLDQLVGAGTLTFATGTWSGDPRAFVAGGGSAINIEVTATDTLSDIAGKINGSAAGVSATVLNDVNGERLLLQSKTTGENAGYQMTATGAPDGLARLNGGSTTFAQNAQATVNGVPVTSATNTFANTVAGVTFTALKVSTEDVTLVVSKDNSAVKKNIEGFVAAYNAINQALSEATRYDQGSKTAGLLQGDSTAVALQNSLRGALQSVGGSGTFKSLSALGVVTAGGLGNLSPNGDLLLDAAKFGKAMENSAEVQAFFRGTGAGSSNEGFAGRFKSFTTNLLASDGFFATKTKVYEQALKVNAKEIAAINDRADRVEENLKARYSALDTKMAGLNALNAYISQQVTTWNKSSS